MPLLLLLALALQAEEFRSVDPELLSRTTPKVDPDADAEAAFWEISMTEGSAVQLDHYVRIKIYSELGREQYGHVDLITPIRTSISDVEGRTIRRDGSIIPLDRSAIFERDILKINKIKVRAVSFAMPSVEPGAVLEYKWREKRSESSLHNQRLDLQREMPVWSVTYRVKPRPDLFLGLNYVAFQAEGVRFVPDEKRGFYRLTAENIPAFAEETHSPPEAAIRPWVLLQYPTLSTVTSLPELHDAFLRRTKPEGGVKRLAMELATGIDDPHQKLDRLAEYCRTKIRNIGYDPKATASERERAGKIKDAGEVLSARFGMGTHVNWLFAALARAAGFQVFLASLPQRDQMIGPGAHHEIFQAASNIAIKHGDGFLFFDPATTFVENRMLRWQEEGTPAKVVDGSAIRTIYTPWSKADRSGIQRTAQLTVSPDATVEGEVRLTYTGHAGVDQKLEWLYLSEEEVHEQIRREVKARLPLSELTSIAVENRADPVKALSVRYRIRVPRFAIRTGRRLFLPVAFFQRGVPPRFETSQRTNSIIFSYPWSERDDVVYKLATGLKPGTLVDPVGLNIGKAGKYEASIQPAEASDLRYRRLFHFVADGQIGYGADYYPSLKQVFDTVHARDGHLIEIQRPEIGNKENVE